MVSAPRSIRPASALFAAALAVAATAATEGQAATGPRPGDGTGLCAAAVAAQEARHGIPKNLLTAISLVESGRWDADAGRGTAWPWTVTAQGKGRFFPTKAAAIAAVKRLQGRGVTSIDVGCMQVNLHYHPTAFPSLTAAFDPVRNASYAARFLTELKRDQGSWHKAVQHYHSSTAAKRIPYQKKVFSAWRDVSANDRRDDSEAGRIRRISRRIERDYRLKLSAYKRSHSRRAAAKEHAARRGVPQFLASWPPRSARAQFRAQNLARAWAFDSSARTVRP